VRLELSNAFDCVSQEENKLLNTENKRIIGVLTGFGLIHIKNKVVVCRGPNANRLEHPFSADEMSNSLKRIFRLVQHQEFSPELQALSKSNYIRANSPLKFLNIFLDDDKIMRVGGIKNSNESFDTKHQMVLPKSHHLTKILIRSLHELHGHASQQALLALVRQNYWPIGAKSTIRNVTRSCVRCFKCSPRTTEQIMGDLPNYRVNVYSPFTNTGVNYSGPMQLKLTRRTNTTIAEVPRREMEKPSNFNINIKFCFILEFTLIYGLHISIYTL
jgi:hypothetical protein